MPKIGTYEIAGVEFSKLERFRVLARPRSDITSGPARPSYCRIPRKLPMTGRERVLATLNRQKADCIPFEIGGTDCSSVHVIPYKKLRQRMGFADGPIRCGCLTQLVAETDADVMDALGTDAESLWFGSRRTKIWKTPFGVDLIVPELFGVEDLPDGSSVVRNRDGAIYARRAADAYYHDPLGTPLAHVTSAAELDRFDASSSAGISPTSTTSRWRPWPSGPGSNTRRPTGPWSRSGACTTSRPGC